ncbi:hypothetical protein D3C76_1809600 [compost metagenome]
MKLSRVLFKVATASSVPWKLTGCLKDFFSSSAYSGSSVIFFMVSAIFLTMAGSVPFGKATT